MATLQIVRLGPEEVVGLTPQLVAVYEDAYRGTNHAVDAEAFACELARDTERSGFCCYAVQEANSAQIAGFYYGYTAARGQPIYDAAASVLPDRLVDHWLTDCLHIPHLAADPRARMRHRKFLATQGRGIGDQLHTTLDDLRCRTIMASVVQQETAAMKLYRKEGWVLLLHDLRVAGDPRPWAIIGLDLERRRSERSARMTCGGLSSPEAARGG